MAVAVGNRGLLNQTMVLRRIERMSRTAKENTQKAVITLLRGDADSWR
jgi:hypothetical protein